MEASVFWKTEALQNKDAEQAKSLAEVMESATSNYKSLEEEHFKNLNIMKETEERTRNEAAKRIQMEEKMAQLKEKMRKLETECIQSIGEAREDGKEEVMEEVKAQFQMVYNSGFKDGWKSALNKAEVPDASDLFLRDNTPLPYPDTRLKDTDTTKLERRMKTKRKTGRRKENKTTALMGTSAEHTSGGVVAPETNPNP
uniref:Uncharacterized protein n=1 Tax=Fagus sylvatica TaxID=28930 RepID=A0A2N9J834_FAGSY